MHCLELTIFKLAQKICSYPQVLWIRFITVLNKRRKKGIQLIGAFQPQVYRAFVFMVTIRNMQLRLWYDHK